MNLSLLVFFLCFFLFMSAMLSATETAFFSLSSMKIRSFSASNNRRWKLVSELIFQPRKLLVTILMLNVLMNILIQNVVSGIFSDSSGWLLSVLLPLILVLIFGEIIPKTAALANNVAIAHAMAPSLRFFEKMLRFVRDGIVWVTAPLSQYMFFFLRRERDISLDELKHALRTSKSYGVLGEEEATLVRGFLNLQDFVVKEVMCPRQEILAYDIARPISELLELFVDRECSRVPVYEGDLENIVGVISSKTFFLHRHKVDSANTLRDYLDPVIFVPESIPARDVLRRLYAEKIGLMIVVDEYSSVCGLVALEDLVEVIVGQIEDKRDEHKCYTVVGEGVIIASGKTELSQLEELFDVKLHSENNMATIGGWLIEQFGDIPQNGAKLETEEFLFHVLSAEPNRVRRVYIRKLKPGDHALGREK